MSNRFLASLIVVAAASLMPVSGAGQTPAWTPPLTSDGHPDLQGIWLSNGATPLERPAALAGKPLLTDKEVSELKDRAHRILNDGKSDFPGGDGVFLAALANVDQFKSANATGGSDDMVEREFDNRTSLISDPPDGKIPPLTPDARRQLNLPTGKSS